MQSLQQLLRSACEDGAYGVNFRESYSGRRMHGDRCIGIVGSFDACMEVIREVNAELTQEVFDAAINCGDGEEDAAYNFNDEVQEKQRQLLNFAYDSMGHGVIIYWPRLKPIEDDEEDGDNE